MAYRRADYEDKRLDVFALVKQNMADDHLIQNPLLVLPQALVSQTEKFLNEVLLGGSNYMLVCTSCGLTLEPSRTKEFHWKDYAAFLQPGAVGGVPESS